MQEKVHTSMSQLSDNGPLVVSWILFILISAVDTLIAFASVRRKIAMVASRFCKFGL
jgi:hypothetical protein